MYTEQANHPAIVSILDIMLLAVDYRKC